jgi:uncharacterized protein
VWRRYGLLVLGYLALGLGCAGIVLPLLPTTPFLLLASYCFIRSSPAMHRWLLAHPWFSPWIRDWEERRAVRRSVKVVAVLTVLGVVTLSWVWSNHPLWIRSSITALAAIGLFVVWRLPVVPRRPKPESLGCTD